MASKRAGEGEPDSASKKPKADIAAYRLNINAGVDKEHESLPFKELVKLPPGALQGLKAGKADDMLAEFKIRTIEDLGKWKYFRIAKAIQTLAAIETEEGRHADSKLNLNLALDKAYEQHSFKEILDLPPSALQGLADWTDGALKDLGIKSVKDLAGWKYAEWADAITVAAEFETEDFRS